MRNYDTPLVRARLALHVLRGRPLGYKIRIQDGTLTPTPNTHLYSCVITGGIVGIRVNP